MNQSRTDAAVRFCKIFFLVSCALFTNLSCGRPDSPPPATQPGAATPRIASLVPAATDLLLAMGARDRLVAVSNFDQAVDVNGLPRVGDYQQVDWEALAAARPTSIIVQMRADRMPAGLADRVTALHATLANVTVETVDDVFALGDRLGAMSGEPGNAATLTRSLRSRLNAVERASAGHAKVAVLLTVDVDPKSVVGRGPFFG